MNIFAIGDNGLLTADTDMDYLDIWGANVYEGITFGTLFDDYSYRARSRSGYRNSVLMPGIRQTRTAIRLSGMWMKHRRLNGIPASGTRSPRERTYAWGEPCSNIPMSGGKICPAARPRKIMEDSLTEPISARIRTGILTMSGTASAAVSKNVTGPDTVTLRQAAQGLRTRWASSSGSSTNVTVTVKNYNISVEVAGTADLGQMLVNEKKNSSGAINVTNKGNTAEMSCLILIIPAVGRQARLPCAGFNRFVLNAAFNSGTPPLPDDAFLER